MESAAGLGGSLLVLSSQPAPRRGWRVVSQQSYRENRGETHLQAQERVKIGLSDERTVYEVQEGTAPRHVDFYSMTTDGAGLSDEALRGRLQEISRQREELLHLEIKLRAQSIARSQIIEMHQSYRSQIKDHIDVTTRLKVLDL